MAFSVFARAAFVVGFLFVALGLRAQPEPYTTDSQGRMQQLALVYYKIDFTPEQRKLLSNLELEFIFRVDSVGNLALEDVNGLHDAAILDAHRFFGTPCF